MKKTLILTICCAVFAGSANLAFAQKPGNGDRLEGFFTKLDKNGDGAISVDELPEQAKERLAKADANGDGKIEKSELQAAMQQRMAQGQRPGADGKPGREGKGKPGQGQDRGAMLFQRLDKDGNGTISAEEAPEKMKENFAQIDTNSDSQLDAAELKVVFEKMRDGKGNRDGAGKPKRDGKGKGEGKGAKQPKRPAAAA